MGALKDLTGQRFGRLTVLMRAGSSSNGGAKWLCQCDCGKDCIQLSTHLLSGRVNSCGCARAEFLRHCNITHGKRKSRLYGIWASAKQRCCDPNSSRYHRYGGRGITICDEWKNDFQAFYEWAMANGYDENAPRGQCTLDRIDNDKGYYPDNCRWVDMKTQNNNRSNNRKEKNNEKNETYQN